MRYVILGLLSALLLVGCGSNKEIYSNNNERPKGISNLQITTSKGKPAADLQAEEGCGKDQKSPVFAGSHPSHDGIATVYSYTCR